MAREINIEGHLYVEGAPDTYFVFDGRVQGAKVPASHTAAVTAANRKNAGRTKSDG